MRLIKPCPVQAWSIARACQHLSCAVLRFLACRFEQHCIYEWDDTRKAFRDCFAGVSMSSSPASSTSRQGDCFISLLFYHTVPLLHCRRALLSHPAGGTGA